MTTPTNKSYIKLEENDAVRSDTNEINERHSKMVTALVKDGSKLMAEWASRPREFTHGLLMLADFIRIGRMLDKSKRMLIYNEKYQNPEPFIPVINPDSVLFHITPEMADRLHHAIGIATEAVEIIERVFEEVTKPEEVKADDNHLEELGDIEFYLKGYRANLGISRDDTLLHNLAKLAKRYAGYQYSDKQAGERNDKKA